MRDFRGPGHEPPRCITDGPFARRRVRSPLLTLCAFGLNALMTISCTTSVEDGFESDSGGSADDVSTDIDSDPADAGRDTQIVLDFGTADMPGTCFEWWPTEVVDVGRVKVGVSHEVAVPFFVFCSDPDARVLGVSVLDATPGLEVGVRGPGVERALVGATEYVYVKVEPTVEGTHRTSVRLAISHGYYDVTIELDASEAVSDVGEPCDNGSQPCTAGSVCMQTEPAAECAEVWSGTCEPMPGPPGCSRSAPKVCDCDGTRWHCEDHARNHGVGGWLRPCEP